MARNQATVKSVLSGDTVILRSRARPGQRPAERQLSLEKLTAPRLGRRESDDEPFAFESRDYLRRLLVGKDVFFQIGYTTQGGREYGQIFIGNEAEPVNHACVRNGWCRVRDEAKRRRDDESAEEDAVLDQLAALEEQAKDAKVGVWAEKPRCTRIVHHQLPGDARAFAEQHKGTPISAIIEQVRDGSTLRVQLIYPGADKSQWIHQYAVVLLSGVRAPVVRTGIPDKEDVVEPFGEEAKLFVETRLLQREVKVVIEGRNQNLIGSIIHPAGNIAEALVAEGLAHVADGSVALCTGGPAKLRAAERIAKEKKRRIWKNYTAAARAPDATFTGVVTRIISGDTLHVLPKGATAERKIRLSSTRQPRMSGEEAGYAQEAKEVLRKRLVGKTVQVTIDYVQPAQDNFEERECATVKQGNVNIAEMLVARGLAGVIYHRQDDENRAKEYDQLRAADEAAKNEGKGMHSGKPKAVPRYTDASEDLKRANSFLPGFKRAGRVSAVVEHVANAARFRLLVPKDNCKLTLVLSGVQAPRVGRTAADKSDPFGQEALDFVARKCLQRDVEIEFESTDKTGGFIGSLWLGKNENIAVSLLENGLATTNPYSADQSPYTNQLYAAEHRAKSAGKNVWANYDEKAIAAEAAERAAEEAAVAAKPEELRIAVADIGDAGQLSVQVIGDGVKALEELMPRLALHHKQSSAAPAQPYRPKNNELCSARFTEDNQWYRARVRRHVDGGKSVEVHYIDYGNAETLPLERVRPLPDNFTKLPAQSREAVFAFLKVPARSSDYGDEAAQCIGNLVGGRTLAAVVEAKAGSVLHVTLYDEALPASQRKYARSLNAELVRSGFAAVNTKSTYARARKNAVDVLQVYQNEAKRTHVGVWEYGDAFDEE
ncbi:hypothetical protein THASP1DRAFT_22190 [Thamnocephalis sphaerospora]|uniref:Staphylococcal nuclease domain-containing protein n=1 Tax=Thamnocephalis sphaerospora TaxID=78915 RepID=A0A4P9XUY2_9FUNG|nr:hypothetical protein THASP1DRAFT_22190 [Thamnocephalis sphaerospora]|eukprot:RKP10055.1 hypothetical protein THASP1DRAFT_22190 [Thamnocephalis sphaerospora]